MLAPEARGYLEAGATSEVQFYRAVPDGGASVKDLQATSNPKPRLSSLSGVNGQERSVHASLHVPSAPTTGSWNPNIYSFWKKGRNEVCGAIFPDPSCSHHRFQKARFQPFQG